MQSMPGEKSQPCSLYRCGRIDGNVYSVNMEDSIVEKTRRRGNGRLNVPKLEKGNTALMKDPKPKARVSTRFQ